MRSWKYWLLFAAFCYSGQTYADGEYTIGLSLTNAMDQNVTLDYYDENPSGRTFSYYIGFESLTNASDQLGLLQLGFRSELLSGDVSTGFEYRYWGQSGELQTHSFIGRLQSYSENGSVLIKPRLNWIVLYTLIPALPVIDILSPGGEIVFDRYHGENWLSSWTVGLNFYSKDTSKLSSNNKVLLVFSPRTLELASSFNKFYIYYDLSYANETRLTGINVAYTVSAIDNSQFGYFTFYSFHSLNKNLDLDYSLATSHLFNSIDMSVGLTYSW